MPSTYAHYRLGEQVLRLLVADKKRIISNNSQLYRIGLHGPDIFFYYNPLKDNLMNHIGNESHKISGKDFFEYASKIVINHKKDEKYLAYVYGMLTHFALDEACHGYVAKKMESSALSHARIEVEFDRYLMLLDQENPLSHPLTRHIAATKENARVIASFYPGADEASVLKCLRGMIFTHKVLLAPKKLKRKLLYSVMYLARKGEYKDYMINLEANPLCEDSNKMLHKLYRKARKNAAEFIERYDCESCFTGKIADIFQNNFESLSAE